MSQEAEGEVRGGGGGPLGRMGKGGPVQKQGREEKGTRVPVPRDFFHIYVPSPLSNIPERLPASDSPGLPQKNCFRL